MSKLIRKSLVPLALILAATTGAQAQWVLNEVVLDTAGSPNVEFVELFNATPASSVDGLSLLAIDIDNPTTPSLYAYRLDLSGTASGTYWLMGTDLYDALPSPDSDQSLGTGSVFFADDYEFLLANTADIDAGWTVGATGFTGTEFNNGDDLLDVLYLTEDATAVFADSSQTAGPDGGFIPTGAARVTNGVGAWEILTFNSTTGALPSDATPGVNNGISSVSDWREF